MSKQREFDWKIIVELIEGKIVIVHDELTDETYPICILRD